MINCLSLTIASDHPAFAGHFPGQPIVPGVVLLDLAMAAIEQHALPEKITFTQMSAVKFLNPVKPAEPLRVEYEIKPENKSMQLQILRDQTVVTSANLKYLP